MPGLLHRLRLRVFGLFVFVSACFPFWQLFHHLNEAPSKKCTIQSNPKIAYRCSVQPLSTQERWQVSNPSTYHFIISHSHSIWRYPSYDGNPGSNITIVRVYSIFQ